MGRIAITQSGTKSLTDSRRPKNAVRCFTTKSVHPSSKRGKFGISRKYANLSAKPMHKMMPFVTVRNLTEILILLLRLYAVNVFIF